MLACLAEVAPGIGAFPRGGRAVSRAIISLDKQLTMGPSLNRRSYFLEPQRIRTLSEVVVTSDPLWPSSGPVHRPRGRVQHWSLTSPSSGRASEGRARATRPAGKR